ncbi:HNH endonuclease signature motif containing protein [Corynebacterium lujinxingii]|uniref:HNH endonuclease n=1 Tax=Corynebacterium lujinxingii TaxID=2763010 RepID=A0A7H0JZN4_9CORY|nr:HNH endonuclease signature motif containing protein [Corynebacterium lujinxingii]MBC3179678.1 HNH endonuclease [Corynebacterium lujinxingii]NNO10371.1 HNH endonuclease [Corynebacterium lujinxingii]QNP90500.1 HNH endonuclease [Corynebacterium lujinxingii]
MNSFAALVEAMSASALETLAGFDLDIALAAGFAPDRARALSRLQAVYFGPTKFTRKQREARSRASGFSLDELLLIERRIAKVSDVAARWGLRLALLEVEGGYRAIEQAARDLVPSDDSPAADAAKFGPARGGKKTLHLTLDEREITDIEYAGRQGIDPAKPAAEQIARNLASIFFGGGGVARAVPRPILAVGLPDFVRIMAGEGDDVVLALSDGTTMTGAEFLAAQFGDILEVAAFHPEAGAVNLYRTERRANKKQRDLAKMVSPVCAFPGCRHGADACELHHVTAWKHGGETNMDNLAPLCRYHNRINDDDPWRKKRGRIVMIRGAPVWISPRGYPVKNTNHGVMDKLFGHEKAPRH